jgi:hypothetical protein
MDSMISSSPITLHLRLRNFRSCQNNVTCWVTEDALRFVTLFIYDFTSRHNNLFLQCTLTLWRCVSERSWFLCTYPWISCDLVFCDLCWSLLGCSAFICLLWSVFCVLSSLFCLYSAAPKVGCWRPGEKTPSRRISFPVLALLRIPTIRLLRNS